MNREELFRRVLDLYFGEYGWDDWSPHLELKNGIYTFKFEQPLHLPDDTKCVLSQREDQVHVYLHDYKTLGIYEGLGTAIAKAQSFEDGLANIKMLKFDPRVEQDFGWWWKSKLFHCQNCSNAKFNSAVYESTKDVSECSSRPIDWICGHDEMQDDLIDDLLDVLLCMNPHCKRYNYVFFDGDLSVVDSGLDVDDMQRRRDEFIRQMKIGMVMMPAVVLEMIADHFFPRSTAKGFIDSNGTSCDWSRMEPVKVWPFACNLLRNELDERGHIVIAADGGRVVKRTKYDPYSTYRFIGSSMHESASDECNHIISQYPSIDKP